MTEVTSVHGIRRPLSDWLHSWQWLLQSLCFHGPFQVSPLLFILSFVINKRLMENDFETISACCNPDNIFLAALTFSDGE
jgi:hypothetical protein